MKAAREQNGYWYTAVAASVEEEIAMQEAYRIPYMIIGAYMPTAPEETVHAIALHHGLPEIRGHYGYDFGEHEFIRLTDATEGEPDKWPSRKISDVLSAAGLLG